MTLSLLTSCEVEFSPNATWKEVPVVYCLLDQDDDTTWARIERCYLGDGDIYKYSTISDSINYPIEQIKAWLIAYDGNSAIDSMVFHDTFMNRQAGSFARDSQPTYYCLTQGWLNENYTYAIRVRRSADGTILCQSQKAISLIKRNATDSLITKPYSGRRFSFKDGNNTCQIEWNALENARIYQPYIRLYYKQNGDTLYTDANCQQVTSRNNAATYGLAYPKTSFLNDIKTNLQADTTSKEYLSMVDIYLLACSEELKTYLFTAAGNATSAQQHDGYTNIASGLGVFAARRTHLYKHMAADDSDVRGGLRSDLRSLGVGF